MSIYVYMYSDNWCADLELLFSASPYNKGHGNVLICFDKNIIMFILWHIVKKNLGTYLHYIEFSQTKNIIDHGRTCKLLKYK